MQGLGIMLQGLGLMVLGFGIGKGGRTYLLERAVRCQELNRERARRETIGYEPFGRDKERTAPLSGLQPCFVNKSRADDPWNQRKAIPYGHRGLFADKVTENWSKLAIISPPSPLFGMALKSKCWF